VHREIVILVVLVGVTVAAFLVTRSFAAANQAIRLQDARAWYTLGERALQTHDTEGAITALRRATAKDPSDSTYRLALASALMASHQDDAARQVLMDLREQEAEDPQTNLQLARLEGRRNDVTAASRYYTNALAALWKPDQTGAQRQMRTEFIEFLLNHGERDRALSELLVLEASLPADLPSQLAAGSMLLTAGDAHRAADHFARALRLDPNNRLALAGAGESSFLLGDYLSARRYLKLINGDTERLEELRTLTDLVLDNDPLAPRLQMTERRRRLADDLAQVVRRIEACQLRNPAERLDPRVDLETPLAEARGFEATLRARNTLSSSDQIDAGFDIVYRAVGVVDRACGSPELLDRAVRLIGQRHGLGDQ
jgi:Tfp pilus assembly protein PilF